MINLRKKKFIIILGVLALFALVLTGCTGVENGGAGTDDGTLNQPTQEEPMNDQSNGEESMNNNSAEEKSNPDQSPEEEPVPDQPEEKPLPDEPAAEKPLPQDDTNGDL